MQVVNPVICDGAIMGYRKQIGQGTVALMVPHDCCGVEVRSSLFPQSEGLRPPTSQVCNAHAETKMQITGASSAQRHVSIAA
ncbi:hypothetical protein [Rhizobium tumorigenes]|uniref:Uncharacterized protein n=1 Tax=Rhizobium tumorigenes TaxID=2041385 RepID=A0AAF1K8T0_9HYPH|nr:hypothetical protein [Rhizobium tumorigenes]WFR97769.1 hypothetical protein PR017_17800 [Rhizobium tumorigenes]